MKKRGLRLWQFIMLLIPLVALPVIMCFPFYSLNKNVAKDTMQDVVQSIKEDLQDSSSEYKDQLLDSFDENLSTDKLEEALDNSLNGMDYDELLRQSEKVWGVNLSSVSGWNLLNLKVDFSVDKLLDLLNEDGNSDSLTRFIVNSVASSIEDKMNDEVNSALFPARLITLIMFLVCIVMIVLLVLSYILKWNKFIVTPGIAFYGGIEIYFATLAMWSVPGSIGTSVSKGFNGALEDFSDLISNFTGESNLFNPDDYTKYGDIIGKFVGKVVMYYYKNMVSVGFWLLFIVGILTVVTAVVAMIFCNGAKQKRSINVWDGPMHVPGITGIKGMYAGADIALENTAISVGRSPQLCQIVVEDPQVNDREFTVYYNVVNQEYIVDWNVRNGWLEKILPPGSPSDYEINELQPGMTYQLKPGSRIMIAGGREGFLLK